MPAKVRSGRVKRVFRGLNKWRGDVVETGTRDVYPFEVPLKSFHSIPKKASVKFTLHARPGPHGKRGKKMAKIVRVV